LWLRQDWSGIDCELNDASAGNMITLWKRTMGWALWLLGNSEVPE